MSDSIKKSLTDMLAGIEGIEFHLGGKIKRSVERDLEIIGEAASRILKEDNEFPLPLARQIISFRNRVIHGYDSVDDNLVWKIIIKDIIEIRTLLSNL